MKVERFDFRNLADGIEITPIVGAKVFVPTGSPNANQPPPPPPPTYTEEDLKVSEREGFKKGFLDGVQEGRRQAESEQAEVNRQLVAMLQTFVQANAPIFDNYRAMVTKLQADLPRVALAIARKVAGDALGQSADVVISDIVKRCVESIVSEPEITITANESMGDTLERHLKDLSVKLPAYTHIVIVRDPAMPKADCKIEWKQGSMERVTEGLWQQIEKIVSDMSIISTRGAAEQMAALEAQLSTGKESPSSKKE